MPVTSTAADSALAARIMHSLGASALIVLGGDGTSRIVADNCGDVPIACVSTGTNNAFPEMREPTITGLAVGLAATGRVPSELAFVRNKCLEASVNDRTAIALVDVAVVSDRFVGSRAIWKPDAFRDLFVTFGVPQSIGMSSIVGLLSPVDREVAEGRFVRFCDGAGTTLRAPIAPGLIEEVCIAEYGAMRPGEIRRPSVRAGSLAFDGEREMTFGEDDDVQVRLKTDAFRTIDVVACMNHAASTGAFIRNQF